MTSDLLQEVVPSGAVHSVRELFVPENHIEATKAEAEQLPALNINKVSLGIKKEDYCVWWQTSAKRCIE